MAPKAIPEIDVWKANVAIAVGLLALHLFTKSHYAGYLYAAFGLIALLFVIPYLSRFIAWAWFKLAEVLGFINTRILLTVIFFVFLMPVALLYRLRNKNLLNRRNGKQLNTLFKDRSHQYDAADLENVW